MVRAVSKLAARNQNAIPVSAWTRMPAMTQDEPLMRCRFLRSAEFRDHERAPQSLLGLRDTRIWRRPATTAPRPARTVIMPTRGVRMTTNEKRYGPTQHQCPPECAEQLRAMTGPRRTRSSACAALARSTMAEHTRPTITKSPTDRPRCSVRGRERTNSPPPPNSFPSNKRTSTVIPRPVGREVEEKPGPPEPDESRGECEDQPANTTEQPPDAGDPRRRTATTVGSILDGGS